MRSLALHCIRSSVIVVQTSAINMLVGLLEPSGGTALIEGQDICTDMASIYAMMGVCPQHDLLWETLTGREHLLFYGRLKNLKVCNQVCKVLAWPCLCCRCSVATACLHVHCFSVCFWLQGPKHMFILLTSISTAVCCTSQITLKLRSLQLIRPVEDVGDLVKLFAGPGAAGSSGGSATQCESVERGSWGEASADVQWGYETTPECSH